MIAIPDAEVAATRLRAHPDYRVLRRFVPRESYHVLAPENKRTALYIDVESTGLDTTADRIIQLAFVAFEFDQDGNVGQILASQAWLEDPRVPIPAEVSALTGITDEMVRGQRIDDEAVIDWLFRASLVIAHNADFDRKLVERRLQEFARFAWACSYREVEWDRFGCVGAKLQHILEGTCGEFYDAHRALDDCRVGVHVLAAAQLDGQTALSYLLDSALRPTVRVWANGAPFEMKDALKQRGYRWHDGTTGRSKCWYRDCTADESDAEMRWLQAQYVRGQVQHFTALDRYSARVG